MTNDTYYIVRLKEYIPDHLFYRTIIENNSFCGKIVNQTCKKIYFEIYGNNVLVIIPHEWIEWMAPSRILLEKQISDKNKVEETKLEKLIAYIEDAHDYAIKPERSFFMNDKERAARCMGIEDILSYIENVIKEN